MSLLKFFLRDVPKWIPELSYHYQAFCPSQLMAKLLFKWIMQNFGVIEISNLYLPPNNLYLTEFYFSSKYSYAKVKTRERQRNLRYWYLHGAVSSIHIGCLKTWMSKINIGFAIYFDIYILCYQINFNWNRKLFSVQHSVHHSMSFLCLIVTFSDILLVFSSIFSTASIKNKSCSWKLYTCHYDYDYIFFLYNIFLD